MTEISWAAISAIAAATAAMASLVTVLLTVLDRRRNEKNEVFGSKVAVFAKLVLVDRALDNALRVPNKNSIGKVRTSLYELLRKIGDIGAVDPVLLDLCRLIEETTIFVDELDFTQFGRDVVTGGLSSYELRFRCMKNDLEEEIYGSYKFRVGKIITMISSKWKRFLTKYF